MMPDAAADLPYLDYRIRWRSGDARPGRHAARQAGSGGDFHAYRPFWQLPDANRIDVRRSILDAGGGVVVRQMEQRSAACVVLTVDVSRSMDGALGIPALARAAARSALRAGDSFGLLAFDGVVREDLCLAPTRSRVACREAADALARFSPVGRSAEGVLGLAARLPVRRCLVILVSDFLMPLTVLERALAGLARHDVAPVVVLPPGADALPRAGLLRVRDAESGGTRLLLMRPSVHRRWREAERTRRLALDGVFGRTCRGALHVRGWVDIAAVSDHLMRG